MGVLYGSLTQGRGNKIGCMGEILVHDLIGGERVGDEIYDYDIITPSELTVDVKTTQASSKPEPHYTARIYGSESQREKLINKCDIYFFVRCNQQLSLATLVGWLPSHEFFDLANYTPKGGKDGDDWRPAYSDQYTVAIAELNSPASFPT